MCALTKTARFFAAFALIFALAQPTQAATFHINGDVIGEPKNYVIKKDDTLYDIARQNDLGIVELLAANPGIDPWIPEPGTEIILPTMHVLPPTPHKGIVVNLAELRLYYYPDADTVMTFPLGIGSEGWQTPVTQTKIIRKRKDPVWIPPPSIRAEEPDLPEVFPAGPDNPLGAYALDLALGSYRIHGTNKPYGIGWRSSHGCMRLYPEDIETLFPLVQIGTPVTIIDRPAKLGWTDDGLWLEITPTQQQADIIADYKAPEPVDIPGIHQDIEEAAHGADVNWHAVNNALKHPNGVPILITHNNN